MYESVIVVSTSPLASSCTLPKSPACLQEDIINVTSGANLSATTTQFHSTQRSSDMITGQVSTTHCQQHTEISVKCNLINNSNRIVNYAVCHRCKCNKAKSQLNVPLESQDIYSLTSHYAPVFHVGSLRTVHGAVRVVMTSS